MSYEVKVIAGQEVAAKIEALRNEMVPVGSHGYRKSDVLCAFQEKMHQAGYLEASIVESNYGYSVRYASGLQNFGLIYSARNRDVNGTLEHAIERATAWAAQDPSRRYVTMIGEG